MMLIMAEIKKLQQIKLVQLLQEKAILTSNLLVTQQLKILLPKAI